MLSRDISYEISNGMKYQKIMREWNWSKSLHSMWHNTYVCWCYKAALRNSKEVKNVDTRQNRILVSRLKFMHLSLLCKASQAYWWTYIKTLFCKCTQIAQAFNQGSSKICCAEFPVQNCKNSFVKILDPDPDPDDLQNLTMTYLSKVKQTLVKCSRRSVSSFYVKLLTVRQMEKCSVKHVLR